MNKKKKAKPITTPKKRTRSKNDVASKPRDFYEEKKSGGGVPMYESAFAEEVARIHTGRPLRGRLKGYA